jgi:cytochrome c peroxidase
LTASQRYLESFAVKLLSFLRFCLVLLATQGSLATATPSLTQGNDGKQNARKIALGQRLFTDPRLSANGQVSCANCHQSAKQFSDGLPLAVGIHGRKGTRNTPSLLDVAQQRTLFWDGRRESLEAQALDPLLNPAEHGLPDEAAVLKRLRADRFYQRAFHVAFAVTPKQPAAELVTTANVAVALAAFQRTLVSGPTPFDRYQAGEVAALDPAARRGWQLFSTTAQCIRCHSTEGPRPLFTDHGFHSLAVGLHRIERKLTDLTQKLVHLHQQKRHQDGHAFDQAVLKDADMAELGRFAVTLNPADIAKFKTPGLRNVALTAPYMHDGSVDTLEEAVDLELYYRGAQDGRPLILTPAERADVVAFLKALSSEGAAVSAKVPLAFKPGAAQRQRP